MVERISSGSYDLNTWLYGGYETDVITMVVGPPGSGKTNFAMLVACSQAKKGKKVIFIDTEGGFSTERVRQIVGDTYPDILKNILMLHPTNFEEQKEAFTTLSKHLKQDQVGLVVVDGMSMLYRLELGEAQTKNDTKNVAIVNRAVAQQMRLLASIARKQNIPVFITNQVYSLFTSDPGADRQNREQFIVGGDLFRYWSKCIIELRHDQGKRSATLLKHRSLPVKNISFEIAAKGIFKKGIL